MEKAKVTVLYDEGALEGTSFIGAKGFSLLVDVDGQRTLFGAGRKERYLANNMYVAGVENDTISQVVVSHGHSDHWSAIPALFRERDEKVQVYSTASAWGVKKMLGTTGIYFGESVMEMIQRNDVADWVQLSEHLYITKPLNFHDGPGEELFLVLISKNGPVLMSGCCHCGLDHVFDLVKEKCGKYPVAVLGGLHIGERKNPLAGIYASYLQEMGCRTLHLNHCTGVTGISKMRTVLGLDGVKDFYTGDSVEFSVF